MQSEFSQIKAEVLRLAKAGNACESEYEKAKSAETIDNLMAVIIENFYWGVRNKLISPELLEIIGDEVLWQHGIYRAGHHEITVSEGEKSIYLLESSTAIVKSFGSSTANVESWGSSTANVESFGSSTANVKSWESSTANVESWGSSTAKDLTRMILHVRKDRWTIQEHEL